MVINMNSCTFYWLKRNPQNLFLIFAAIAFMSIKGSLFADVLALLFISRTTLDIFTEMTYSLPFSRRDIWKFHVTVQAVLMMIFILVNLIQNAGNIWNILVSVFFVLFTFLNCLQSPRRKAFWWIGLLPIIVIGLLNDCSPQIFRIIKKMAVNPQVHLILIAIEIVLVGINIYSFFKEYRWFVKRS